MLELNELQIKGLKEYLQKKTKIFKDYEDILNESVVSSANITLEERKELLATYLYMVGKKEENHLMKTLNYQQTERFNTDLFSIFENIFAANNKQKQTLKGEAIVNEIVEQIVTQYMLNEDYIDKLTIQLNFEGSIQTFLSYKKISILIIQYLNKFEYIYDIRTIIEKIVIEYKKIGKFEFIDLKEIVKYELYYNDENLSEEENYEILYVL